MKSYTYYSDGGYRFFYIDGSSLREITTEDYLDLPQSAIYYCSHYGWKVVYRVLPERKLMLAVLNIPSKTKDDSGRKIPFSMLFIGTRDDFDVMNKLAIVVADNLSGFEQFVGDLFLYDPEGKLYFDSDRLDTFVANLKTLSIPDSSSELSKVLREGILLIFEGSSLKSSLKEFEEQFSRELLDMAVILSKTEALAYQERLGISFKQLIGEKKKEEPITITKEDDPVGIDHIIRDLQHSVEDLKNRNKELVEDLVAKDRQILTLTEQINAFKKILSEKDTLIEELKKKLYLFSGGLFLLGLIIGWFLK